MGLDAIRVEFNGIVWSAAEISNEPGEGMKVRNARTDTCFGKFADSKEDIGSSVVSKIEEGAYSRAEW